MPKTDQALMQNRAIRGRAAGQRMVFWSLCTEQGVKFDLPLPKTGSEPVLNRVWYYKPRDLNPDCEQSLLFLACEKLG